LCEFVFDRERSRLGIRFSDEHAVLGGELIPERLEILDGAVIDDCEPAIEPSSGSAASLASRS
jgi:hypothetical protein